MKKLLSLLTIPMLAMSFWPAGNAQAITNPPGQSVLPMVLPVEDTVQNPMVIQSLFGPRIKNGNFDFHRGIDYAGSQGDDIYAAADGEVFRVYPAAQTGPYSGLGNTVILRHREADGLDPNFQIGTTDINEVYTIYGHLDSFSGAAANKLANPSGQYSVNAGDVIGGMGLSGYPTPNTVHLHFEVRLETTCTYASQLANPSGCQQIGFDPHVDPQNFFANNLSASDYAISANQTNRNEALINVQVSGPSSYYDGIVLEVFSDPAATNLVYTNEVRYNYRVDGVSTSINASTLADLDNPVVDGFTISPQPYSITNQLLQVDFMAEIPESAWAQATHSSGNLYARVGIMTVNDFVKGTQFLLEPNP